MAKNSKLAKFIKEARRRGYSDLQIRDLLLQNRWPLNQIESAFVSLTPKKKFKNQVTIFLDNEIIDILEKRSKKNMFTVSEQIEDILRRSCLAKKRTPKEQKLDDALVALFSRRKKRKTS